MQYTSKNTTDYLVRFRNSQNVNEACEGSLITKGVQENCMNIRLPFHYAGFDYIQEDENKETEKAGEEIICAILYLEKPEKSRFADLKKRVENDYVMSNAEYPRTVTAVQSLLLNYQPNYNYNINYQSNEIRNQLMFAQRGKNGDDRGDGKDKEQRPI